MRDSIPVLPETKLVIVSNRLPVRIENRAGEQQLVPSPGGLVSAMVGVSDRLGYSWVGWPGAPVADEEQPALREQLAAQNLHPVFLSTPEVEHFYNGFSNSVIWPLFHYMPSLVDFTLPHWDEYRKVNERFADAVLPLCGPNTVVWVHDYQLCLVPSLVRQRCPQARIGFFLHIPFPSSEIYRLLPVRRELLEGILGADLIGFHTHEYCRHFASSCMRVLGTRSTPVELEHAGRTIRYGSYPIGIEPERFLKVIDGDTTSDARSRIERAYEGCKVIVGVDRIDYTKGLPQKLQAFETFLEQHPQWVGKLVLVQIAVPSRTDVPEYKALKDDVDRIVGQINGRFGTPDYVPIHYIAKDTSFEELCALYERGDVCLVTALRDGMNLVAMEYTVCQKRRHGVLILSEFCGAASSLGNALIVNPRDIQGVADAIGKALEMSEQERSLRAIQNFRYVRDFNSLAWARRFVRDVLAESDTRLRTTDDLRSAFIELRRDYLAADRRLILLDYDGTLIEFFDAPQEAVPSSEIVRLVERLATSPRNEVYLISGRTQQDLESWFGHLPIGMVAEHGMFVREPGSAEWVQREHPNLDWMDSVRRVLQDVTKRTPGSLIEDKKTAIAWHFRQVEPALGEWQSHELLVHLEQSLANVPVSVVIGHKAVEVRPQGIHKGQLVRDLLPPDRQPPFILCMGDDRTDEDMFAVLPARAWTCRIGQRYTLSRYYLDSPKDVREILGELAGSHVRSKRLDDLGRARRA
ncbi:MAG: bifunctional alpha,alpha-trehalose-phosphate synthase (UDP-forming)/trehalose-phosphatase [Kofleriaceae bacterium]